MCSLKALKIGTLVFIILYGFLGGFGSWSNFAPFFGMPDDAFGAIAGGTVGAFFAFAGWWEVTRIAGEINEPKRNLPRALGLGVVVITLIYILTSAVFLYLVPVSRVTSDETFAAQAGEALFGTIGGVIFASVVVISVFGSLMAYLMGSPRVYYAMAQDGVFFKYFGALHRIFGTPYRAIFIQVVLASILIFTGDFQQILSYFFFVVVLFVAVTVAGLFRVKREDFDGYTTPLYPFTPMFFIVITSLVLLMIATRDPVRALLGVAIVVLGLPVYYLFFRSTEDV